MDELEDDLERERRLKLEQDKLRKKVENELREIEETVNASERQKNELEDVICRKNKELSALVDKLQDEQRLVAKHVKQVKECSVSKSKKMFCDLEIIIKSPFSSSFSKYVAIIQKLDK